MAYPVSRRGNSSTFDCDVVCTLESLADHLSQLSATGRERTRGIGQVTHRSRPRGAFKVVRGVAGPRHYVRFGPCASFVAIQMLFWHEPERKISNLIEVASWLAVVVGGGELEPTGTESERLAQVRLAELRRSEAEYRRLLAEQPDRPDLLGQLSGASPPNRQNGGGDRRRAPRDRY